MMLTFGRFVRLVHASSNYSVTQLSINNNKYILDPLNWGQEDYWEEPDEFAMWSGDCEDYAITKYWLLRNVGFDSKDLRIAIVKDTNLNVDHAVLMLKMDKWVVLDNQSDHILAASQVKHYVPIISTNEDKWWNHIPQIS